MTRPDLTCGLDLSEISAEDARRLRWPPGGKLAFDVGANIGGNLDLLTSLYDRVIALEPCAESFSRIGRRKNVTALLLAAGRRDGTVWLSVRRDPIISGQLVAPGMTNHDWGPELMRRQVPSVTLDSIAGEYGVPDFVKIDTEGFEREVLRGAPRLLGGRATTWMVEFHSPELLDWCARALADARYDVTVAKRTEADGSQGADHGYVRAVPPAGRLEQS